MQNWIVPYVLETRRRRKPTFDHPMHLLLCVADHFEPHYGRPGVERSRQRVEEWVEKYPRLFGEFRDNDGRRPRHTFFYPMEQYDTCHLDSLAPLCADGWGEVELQLHHDNDTSENLRRSLLEFKRRLSEDYGFLGRRRDSNEVAYAFVHGNWCLDNSAPDGRWCGVNDELTVLRETGCYADFTFPSAPSLTQTRQINSIYYACDDPRKPKSHDRGVRVGSAPQPRDSLMLIQGPLMLDWAGKKWGFLPILENSCIQLTQPPSPRRLDLWLKARIQVPSRPDWLFLKLYTHGAHEEAQAVLLGDATVNLHRTLAERRERNANFCFHYVTAREMYNLVRAAESGWKGSVADARDFEILPPPAKVIPALNAGRVAIGSQR